MTSFPRQMLVPSERENKRTPWLVISLRYYSCLKLPEKLVIVLGRLPSIGNIELYSEAYNGRCF